jgi:hypothetical protein
LAQRLAILEFQVRSLNNEQQTTQFR